MEITFWDVGKTPIFRKDRSGKTIRKKIAHETKDVLNINQTLLKDSKERISKKPRTLVLFINQTRRTNRIIKSLVRLKPK